MITSSSNTTIKEIRKLRERKYRTESGLFYLEGIRIVIEALDKSFIEQVIVSDGLLDHEKGREAVQRAKNSGISVLEVSPQVFESISSKDGPQGLAAVGRQRWKDLNEVIQNFSGIWIALYQVADPGNLGTILRTLDGMGGSGVFLLEHCTDPYDPAAIRASMGAIFAKSVVRCSTSEFIKSVSDAHLLTIGTSDSANTDYRHCKYNKDMILLMGSEREGLPASLEAICGNIAAIPMLGSADSLNLAVASSIILYEIRSQVGLDAPKGEVKG